MPSAAQNSSASTSTQPQDGATGSEETESEAARVPDDIYDYYERMDNEDEETDVKIVSFEVNQEHLETIQKRCELLSLFPMLVNKALYLVWTMMLFLIVHAVIFYVTVGVLSSTIRC